MSTVLLKVVCKLPKLDDILDGIKPNFLDYIENMVVKYTIFTLLRYQVTVAKEICVSTHYI